LTILVEINDPGNTMKQILQEISELAFFLNDFDFNEDQFQSGWLGNAPATNEEISNAEDRLGINLPQDYVEFLKIANGFHAASTNHPVFAPVAEIDYLKKLDGDMVKYWPLEDVARNLAKSIKVGGLYEDKIFILIPPDHEKDQWRYWSFTWADGETPYTNLTHYFTDKLEYLKKMAPESDLIIPKPIIDYSLRDFVFAYDWDNVFITAAGLFLQNKTPHYLVDVNDLVRLLFISAGKLNKYDALAELIYTARTTNEQYKAVDYEMIPLTSLEEAARNKTDFFQDTSFTVYENPDTLEALEARIEWRYPHLLEEKNKKEKISWLLKYLFMPGDAPDYNYIKVYEGHQQILHATYHLNAAIIYAIRGERENAKLALCTYFEKAFLRRPLAPFLHPELLEVMDKEFSMDMLRKFKP
jgi:hypothetical protein